MLGVYIGQRCLRIDVEVCMKVMGTVGSRVKRGVVEKKVNVGRCCQKGGEEEGKVRIDQGVTEINVGQFSFQAQTSAVRSAKPESRSHRAGSDIISVGQSP